MTYEEYYKNARENFAIKGAAFEKADKQMNELNGFLDESIFINYQKAKVEWQNASNTYFTFQDFWKMHGHSLNPNSEM